MMHYQLLLTPCSFFGSGLCWFGESWAKISTTLPFGKAEGQKSRLFLTVWLFKISRYTLSPWGATPFSLGSSVYSGCRALENLRELGHHRVVDFSTCSPNSKICRSKNHPRWGSRGPRGILRVTGA